MTQTAPKNPICRKLERDLYHFQAGELPEGEQQALADHLAECPGCSLLMEVEDSFLRGLKARMTRVETAPELRVRVRQALDGQQTPGRFSGWLRTPWLVPAVAGLLLAVVLLPGMPQVGGVVHVEREVLVVDIDCEMAGKTLAEQRDCTHPHHLNALRISSGRYWNLFLDQPLGRRLVADHDMRGHRLHVVGELYAGSQTLHVTDYTDQDLERDLSANLTSAPGRGVTGALSGLQ